MMSAPPLSKSRPPVERFEAFAASMPSDYQEAFSEQAMWQHYCTVRRRGSRPLEVDLVRLEQNLAVFCVVADDRAHLVADIAQLLSSCDLTVVSAQIFTRITPRGDDEAVDLFWIRPIDPNVELQQHQLEACLCAIRTLGKPEFVREPTQTLWPATVPSPVAPTDIHVSLLCPEPQLFVVRIAMSDRAGLLAAVAQVLFAQGLSIVCATVETDADGVARDYFVGRAWQAESENGELRADAIRQGLRAELAPSS